MSKAIADAVSRAFPGRCDLAAYGGEALAILVPDCGEAEVARLAERLLHAVRGLAVTVSVGAAVAWEKETAASLVARAEGALHRSKRAGRNRWCAASRGVH